MTLRRSNNRSLEEALPPVEPIFRILSLTGGGIRGLFTAHALANLEKTLNQNLLSRFDILTGTSIGGIIAIGLAAGISAEHISAGLEKHGPVIFNRSRFAKLSNPKNLFKSAYRPEPLRAAIEEILGDKSVLKLGDIDQNLLIVSADHDATRPVIFASGRLACQDDERNVTLLDAAMATSAAQSYFPPHLIGTRRYVDGGLVCNAPDIVATVRALRDLSPEALCIKLLSVGTTSCELRGQMSRSWGLLFWLFRQGLPQAAFELQQQLSMGLSKQLLGSDYYRLDSSVAENIALDDASEPTISLLKQKADEAVEAFIQDSKAWRNIML